MPLALVIVGTLLIVAAWQNSLGALFRALRRDLPAYGTWAGAIFLVGMFGMLPGMRVPSRWLLALVFIVIFLSNWQRALQGFNLSQSSITLPQPTVSPATQYMQSVSASPSSASVSVGGQAGNVINSIANIANAIRSIGGIFS